MKEGIVEKITNGGWGLVRSDEGIVFLNYVLPGESIAYEIKEKAKGILWGELSRIITASPHRITPPCPYFGQCGGCVFQHMDYSYQQKIKEDIFKDDLLRMAHFETEIPPIIASPPYNNRIRARMKAQPDGKIGFIRKGTNSVIPIDGCLLFPDKFSQFLSGWNHQTHPPFFFQLDILMNRDLGKVFINLAPPPHHPNEISNLFPDIQFCWKNTRENGISSLKIKEWNYFISPTAFFQVNPHQWENMLDTVESFLKPCEKIIDLYSGVGFFIPLLKHYAKHVIGVENTPHSVELGKRAFGDKNIEFLAVSAEKFHFPPADFILVDPPRSGLSPKVMKGILKAGYKKIIFISCASATFARDLKILQENGYKLEKLNIFDLFPQTPHFETIALFKRN